MINGNLTWNIRAAWKKFGNAEIQGNDKDKKNIRNETDSSKEKIRKERKIKRRKKIFQSQMIQRAGKAAIQKYFPNQIQLIQKVSVKYRQMKKIQVLRGKRMK